ncbi:PREDICTED: pre-mRNA-processing factor 39-like [Calidris pugnax]|uniref:pre-mRNA-processing factor 39-like n=1 Tax=Calidris pugnax TaxID=198806 RepID=UPI00071C6076|nr:PREDICTED: pre-mRNA-processing factor 39-like [Calidris pugnax]
MAAEGPEAAPASPGRGGTEGALGDAGDGVTYPPDFEKFWQAARSNPHDFTAWTELLQYVEQENHLFAARKAFDAFFAHYPYCYGYWKKYADMERRFDCGRETEEVFERGLQSIPLSMDLWIHYISYLQSTLDMNLPESIQKIRGVFEAAVAAAGMDFRSDKLWELYVEWEREQGDLRAVTGIYDRVLSMPTQLYNHHWEKFKEHVLHNPPKDILSPEELLWVQSKLATDPVPKPPEPEGTEAPPGEDLPPGVEGKGGASDTQEDLDQEKIRELVISMRQQIYAQNEAEVSKRWNFEDGIKRPYFHVKPLERAQLRNWRDYLDYEIAAGSHERTIVLFERCVIACALYEEFWIKVRPFLHPYPSEDQLDPISPAKILLSPQKSSYRPKKTHIAPKKPHLPPKKTSYPPKKPSYPPKKPYLPPKKTHIPPKKLKSPQKTSYPPKKPYLPPKKTHIPPKKTQRILRSFEEVVPGLAMVRLRRVSLERRQGNLEEAENLLLEAMRANEGLPLASFYAVKLARQACKVQKNLGKARKVLVEALEKEPDNARLHANLLEMEFGADVRQNEGNTMRCFERALRSPLPDEAKLVFSQRRVEFLEDFGSSIHSLLTAYDEHQKILKQHAARKRAPENG